MDYLKFLGKLITIVGPARAGKSHYAFHVAKKLESHVKKVIVFNYLNCFDYLADKYPTTLEYTEENLISLMQSDGGNLVIFIDYDNISEFVKCPEFDQICSKNTVFVMSQLPILPHAQVKVQTNYGSHNVSVSLTEVFTDRAELK